MAKSLGIAIITLNEETTIASCIDSVSFAQEIVVVDSGSKDRTVDLAKAKNAKVIFNAWSGYGKQKKFAIEQLHTDWVLILDADEFLTPELQNEIKQVLNDDSLQVNGYYVPRQQVFMGKILKRGKAADRPLRLFIKKYGVQDERNIHEQVVVQGKTSTLKYSMIHFSAATILERLKKMNRDIVGETEYLNPDKIGYSDVFISPLRYFFSYLIRRGTWMDGVPGIILLAIFAFQLFMQNAVMLEKRFNRNPEN